MLLQGKFEKEASELRGLAKYTYARFGSAIADIGDIDGNHFNDVAVGAPLEEDNAGSVYIYNGFMDGIKHQFSQVGYTVPCISLDLFTCCNFTTWNWNGIIGLFSFCCYLIYTTLKVQNIFYCDTQVNKTRNSRHFCGLHKYSCLWFSTV